MGREHIDKEIKLAKDIIQQYKEHIDSGDTSTFYFSYSNGGVAAMFICDIDRFRSYYKNHILARSPMYFSSYESYLINVRPSNMSIISSIIYAIDKSYKKPLTSEIRRLDNEHIRSRWDKRHREATTHESTMESALNIQVDMGEFLTLATFSTSSGIDNLKKIIEDSDTKLYDAIANSGKENPDNIKDDDIIKRLATYISMYKTHEFIDQGVRYSVQNYANIKYVHFSEDTFKRVMGDANIAREFIIKLIKDTLRPIYIVDSHHK